MRQRARLLMISIVGVSALILLGGLAALTGQTEQEQQSGSTPDFSSEPVVQESSAFGDSENLDFGDEVLTVQAALSSAKSSEQSASQSAQSAKADAQKATEAADAAAQSAADAAALVAGASAPNTPLPQAPAVATGGVATDSTDSADPQAASRPVTTAATGDQITGSAPSKASPAPQSQAQEIAVPAKTSAKSELAADSATDLEAGGSQSSGAAQAKGTVLTSAPESSTPAAEPDKAAVRAPTPSSTTAATSPNSSTSDGMANLSDRGLTDNRGVKAFPGAEGGGQYSNGGRGGAVVTVNTTDCSDEAGDGKISWKEAWQSSGDVSPGDRTVVFAVGGLFDCGRNTNQAKISAKGELTVACQTAPWPGVNIAAYRLEYKGVKNVIVRGCQFLNHDIAGDSASMFRVVTTGSSSDIIADRITGLHGPDDFTMGYVGKDNKTDTMNNITLSNSIIAENDAYSTHSESTPQTGAINRYQHSHGAGCSAALNTGARRAIQDCSFIGNLFAHNNRRNPKFWGSSGQVIGNMGYNIGEAGYMVLQRDASEIDVWLTDNFFKYGPNTKTNIQGNGYRIETRSNGSGRVRAEGNTYQLANNGKIVDLPDRLDNPKNNKLTFQPTRDWTAKGAFDCVGATHRDANVDRIIREVNSATGEIGIGIYGNPKISDGDAGRHWLASEGGNANYYPTKFHPASYDTDRDGMADAWEKANGLIVGTKDHNGDLDRDGYTNIEEFVNSLMRCD